LKNKTGPSAHFLFVETIRGSDSIIRENSGLDGL
jgi:hypothetical protein